MKNSTISLKILGVSKILSKPNKKITFVATYLLINNKSEYLKSKAFPHLLDKELHKQPYGSNHWYPKKDLAELISTLLNSLRGFDIIISSLLFFGASLKMYLQVTTVTLTISRKNMIVLFTEKFNIEIYQWEEFGLDLLDK